MAALDTARRRRWLSAAVLGFTAFVLLTWLVHRANGPTALDQRVLASVVDARTAALTLLAKTVTNLGSTVGAIIAAIAAAVTLLLRTRALRLTLILTIAVVETAALVFLIKEAIGRSRPPVDVLIGHPSSDPSFPSGHTTNGTVVWVLGTLLLSTTLVRRWSRALLIAAGLAAALGIGLSRVYLGYHWTTDVLGGWLLATAVCSTAMYVVCRFDRATTIADTPAPPLSSASVRSGHDGSGRSLSAGSSRWERGETFGPHRSSAR